MPQHCPLGSPGGAAGILQQREVLRADIDRSQLPDRDHFNPALDRRAKGHVRDLLALQQLERQPLVPRQLVGEAAHHQRFERRTLQHLCGGLVEFGHVERHQHPCAAVADLPAQFLDRIERREVHHHRARHHRAVIGGGVDRDVGQKQPDTVALGDPDCLEPRGKGLRLLVDLAVAVGAPEEMQERRLRVHRHSAFKQRRQARGLEGGVERDGVVIGGLCGGDTDSHVSNSGAQWLGAQAKVGEPA